MPFPITPCRLAVSAAFAGLVPLSASAAPTVYFVTPGNGATISGSISQSSACEARGSNIKSMRFYLDSTALNTEGGSPWNCNIDTRKFSDGTHTLRAVAYDSAGVSRSTQISVNIQNGTTGTSSGGASFKAPTAGATLSGSISASSSCEVVGSNIKGVQFYLDSTALNKEGTAPWTCNIDTTKFSDGAHTLKAVTTYADGKTGTTQIPVTIKNGSTSPAPAPSDPVASNCANPSGGYEGFGRNTTGGAGKPVYKVTNLNDSGSGSLRDALSQGNRCVVFNVGGTISLSSNLLVKGANVTIDGLTAPAPGITLKSRTLVVQGSSGARNVVLRGIRVRGTVTGEDAVRLYGTSDVVVDRMSISGAGDGALDVTEKSRNVTLQWNILGNGGASHNVSLIKYNTARVTVHHNLYINSENRSPHCALSETASSPSSEIICDVRNNLIWNFYKGTEVRKFGTANVVNNYYYTTKATTVDKAVYRAEGGVAYVSGNHSGNGWSINKSDRSTPYAADVPKTTDAITAAREVLAKAGARGPKFGLDSADQNYVGQVSIR